VISGFIRVLRVRNRVRNYFQKFNTQNLKYSTSCLYNLKLLYTTFNLYIQLQIWIYNFQNNCKLQFCLPPIQHRSSMLNSELCNGSRPIQEASCHNLSAARLSSTCQPECSRRMLQQLQLWGKWAGSFAQIAAWTLSICHALIIKILLASCACLQVCNWISSDFMVRRLQKPSPSHNARPGCSCYLEESEMNRQATQVQVRRKAAAAQGKQSALMQQACSLLSTRNSWLGPRQNRSHSEVKRKDSLPKPSSKSFRELFQHSRRRTQQLEAVFPQCANCCWSSALDSISSLSCCAIGRFVTCVHSNSTIISHCKDEFAQSCSASGSKHVFEIANA